MFRCELCQRVVPPGTRSQKIAVRRRTKKYPVRRDANSFYRLHKRHVTDDPGGTGQETVKEVIACPSCAANRQQIDPAAKVAG
jgi:hypothetical protein